MVSQSINHTKLPICGHFPLVKVGAGSSRPDVGDQGTLGWEDGASI